MAEDTIEISVERANLVHNLLVAAQNWRANLISKTGTATWPAVVTLLEAVAAFDRKPCEHPREWRVFFPESAGKSDQCGYCGASNLSQSSPL